MADGDNPETGDPYGSRGKEWFDLISQASGKLTTPQDWYEWGKSHPGFFGTYVDPTTGETKNTPPPPSLVPSGYQQDYNPKTGKWDVQNDSNGGFFGFVEKNPYAFAALAATALAGGVALAPAAGAAAAAGGAAASAPAVGAAAAAAPAVAGGAAAAGGGILGTLATYAPIVAGGVGLLGGIVGGKKSPSGGGGDGGDGSTSGAPGESNPGNALSSADILAQGRNLAEAGVPFAVGGVLESVNALRAKAVGSSAEILPSIVENLAQLRSQYGDASKAVARKLGYAGGGQVTRERQKLLGTATRQYAGLIQNAQQQGVAGLNQVEGGFAPLVSGVAREPSRSQATSPFDASGTAEGVGSLLAGIPGLLKAGQGLFKSNTPSSLPATTEPVDKGGIAYGPTTIDVFDEPTSNSNLSNLSDFGL